MSPSGVQAEASASTSWFADTKFIPPDAIFALTALYNKDPSPSKVNLGQGTYRDDAGKPWILPAVEQARKQLFEDGLNHEYLPILGLNEFRERAAQVALGPCYATCSERVTYPILLHMENAMLTDSNIAFNLSKSFWHRWFTPHRLASQSMSRSLHQDLHT